MERIISIKSQSIVTTIGVSKEEQAVAQHLLCDVCFAGSYQLENLQDDLAATIDYAHVYQRVHEIAGEHPRKLIETLADDITLSLLREFKLRWIELTIRKFILPNTEYVAVKVRRESDGER